MGISANILRIPMTQAGFNYNRNYELLDDTALMDPSCNYNLHELGLGKRGGTSILVEYSDNYAVRGGYDFRQSNGTQTNTYAKANGKVYANDDSTVIATGMSTNNFFSFDQLYDTLFFADGASTPKYWTGTGSATNVTAATSWATTGYPFQILYHARGANARMWAITKDGVYASKNGDGKDFADADVKYIPVYSKGGLVGGIEFGGELFVFSKTESFRISDSSSDLTTWGYTKAIWEGGAAHWRLLIRADNDVFILTDDLNIYSLQGVFQTGDYRKSSITREAQIDRYLREMASIANIDKWHACYDPKLRCIKWFFQVGGIKNNTALVQFIDRPLDKMWAIHNNLDHASGYDASCSYTYRKTVSDWRIRTGDYSGNVWELEQSTRNDNNQPYTARIKFKPWDFKNPLMHKHFPKGVFRARANTNIQFNVGAWVNNVRMPDLTIDVISSGATFDSAIFDSSVFASDDISKSPFDIKFFGSTLQFQINHYNKDEDFFISELILAFKELGVRVFA